MYPIVSVDALRAKLRDADNLLAQNRDGYIAIGDTRDSQRKVPSK